MTGDPVSITVDATDRLQDIDGYGASTISLIFPTTGDNLASFRDDAIEAAFQEVNQSRGFSAVGLFETPADATDPWGQRANDNGDPDVIDWSGFNSTDSDEMYQDVLSPASSYGYDHVILGPILNVSGALSWLRDIRDSGNYQLYLDEAAEHVEAVVRHWTTEYGVQPDMIQLFNEPTSGNNELDSNSAQEVVDLVKAVGQHLDAEGLGGIPFVVPNEETMSRSYSVAQAILADAEARPYVGAIGYHPYPYGSPYSSVDRILEDSGMGSPDGGAVQEMEALKELGAQYGIPVWLTEVTEGPGRASYPFGAMETLLARAIHIHDNFEYAEASAFFGMLTIWDEESHADHYAGRDIPFLEEQSHMVLVDKSAGDVMITGMGYAVGHYARWAGTGSARLAASADDSRVLVSAFLTPAEDEVVVVVVNTRTDAKALELDLTGATPTGTASGERSYDDVRWETFSGSATDGDGTVSVDVPARSVVTVSLPIQ